MMSHEHCIIGSKPGTPGAWCFTHAVSITRVGSTWQTSNQTL